LCDIDGVDTIDATNTLAAGVVVVGAQAWPVKA
jgi:hypothetical protein